MKILKRFICLFIPLAKVRHRILRHDGSLLRVIENGVERKPRLGELRHIFVTQCKGAKGNVVKIELPVKSLHLTVDFEGDNNTVIFHANSMGTCSILFHDNGGFVEMGTACTFVSCFMNITGSGIRIGNDCMLSENVVFYANDAHTLFDTTNGLVLNERPKPIIVGNHCWLGKGATFTKNAQIPDETVVGIHAIVTKKFTKKYTAIAGVPAKVVRFNVGWDRSTPGAFTKKSGK